LKDVAQSNPEQLIFELRDSQEAVERELNVNGIHIKRDVTAYPYGAYDADVLEATHRYYRMAFSIGKPGDISDLDCPLTLPRFGIQRSEKSVEMFKKQINAWIANNSSDSVSEEY
jgi:hypothetical protein